MSRTLAEPILLFVDDDEERLGELDAWLAPLGHRRRQARSPDEALAALREENNVAVAIVAIDRAFDPFVFTATVAKRPPSRSVPVVLIGHEDSTDAWEKTEASGAADFMVWPLEPVAVRVKFTAYLDRARRRSEDALYEQVRQDEQARRETDLLERNHLLALFADVGIALGTQPTLAAALDGAARAVVRHLDAAFARIWTVSADGTVLELQASAGMYTHLDGPHSRVPIGRFKIGLIAAERKPHLTNQVVGDPRVGNQAWARENGMVAFAGYPMLLGGRLVGVIAAFARHPLSDAALSAFAAIASSIAQGIERAEGEAVIRESEARLSATTELLRAQAVALEASKNEAEAANRTKGVFLANMSHELRTPLNAVIGYGELLHEEATERGLDDLVPDILHIQRAGRHLLGLIDDVLQFSRIEAGRMDVELETFGVDALIADVDQTVRPLIELGLKALVVDVAAGISMRADLTKVRQILINLLSNAAKFTQAGTIGLAVHRGTGAQTGKVLMRVSDTGIGIPAAQVAQLFEPFMQGDASTTRKFGGTGLGLAISRRYARMMGGEIEVTSEVGKGSTFTLVLPMQPSEPEPRS